MTPTPTVEVLCADALGCEGTGFWPGGLGDADLLLLLIIITAILSLAMFAYRYRRNRREQ